MPENGGAERPYDPAPFADFTDVVSRAMLNHIGRDAAGNETGYVPFDNILDHYLRIFSTLVYAGRHAVPYLHSLFISRGHTDAKLPWAKPPPSPDDNFFTESFRSISDHQWRFFPLDFQAGQLDDLHLEDRRILPITLLNSIYSSPSGAVKIDSFTIHPGFDHLGPKVRDPSSPPRTLILKTYNKNRNHGYYKNEREGLQAYGTIEPPNIIRLYGSFQQLGSCCLILEYLDGGDLADFFRNDPPSTGEEVAQFWTNFFQIFHGLARIHQLWDSEENITQGIHQDLRPENILLQQGPSGSCYDFIPKLADFGLYTHAQTFRSTSGGPKGRDQRGNKLFRPNMITQWADIYSIGAIISHTASWIVGGISEQNAYQGLRDTYHKKYVGRIINGGYAGCFHDRIKTIPPVTQQHDRIRGICRQRSDEVTPMVLDLAEKSMLGPLPKDREAARIIRDKFIDGMYALANPGTPPLPPPSGGSVTTLGSPMWSNVVSPTSTLDGTSNLPLTPLTSQVAGLSLKPTITVSSHGIDTVPSINANSSENTLAAASHLTEPTLPTANSDTDAPPRLSGCSALSSNSTPCPIVSVDQVNEYKTAVRRKGKPADPDVADLFEYLQQNFGGRDQMFFIDDSRTMGTHDRDTISSAFKALGYMAKHLDPNKVELVFASDPKKVHKAKKIRKLNDLVTERNFAGEPHYMNARLGEFLGRVIIPHLPFKLLGRNINPLARKKVSVYIFTDGEWGPDLRQGQADGGGLQQPVQNLVKVLKRRELDRTQVSLHFVRFGDSARGEAHLKHLDDCLREDDWDIIDVKHINSGVRSMMIGPLTRDNDDREG
ncbi:uncharacterized protein C8A04DRAFT_14814 [Dichotomopilus funicola]|uniref:Protein kinase domain-containing protein n=1 Tax=Dichotomopilus funicola TaxID=1934379 RepID=A0AAN6UXZ7_9PEZI|nr:hypothetical protein C8A04DRAFT_14814 [Dichotomopilus funicola]